MNKEKLKTKRMLLQPMSNEEIEALIKHTDSEELKRAYCEMLEGCKKDSKNRVWYAPWKMKLKKTGEMIGDLCFKGPEKNHSVEIGYGVLPEQEGNGYTTEAVMAMTQWAFSKKEVVFVEAETEPDNKASQRVLAKCGFQPGGAGTEGPRFVLESPMTDWSMIDMCFGMSFGMAIGTQQNQMVLGMAIGMSLGLGVGTLIYASAKKEREKIRQERKNKENKF